MINVILYSVFDMRLLKCRSILHAAYVSIACWRIVGAAFDKSRAGIDWEAYELGDLSPIPLVHYHSADFSSPLVHVTTRHQTCQEDSLILLSPRGKDYPGNKVLLLDDQGALVWHHKERGAVSSMQVQTYKGEDYLTYWVGDDNFWGHGVGYYKMLDYKYDIAYAISAGNGLDGDYHEFSITPDNTALLTAYIKTSWDLSTYGREEGFIWDCAFQEIDIETNEVLFEWRASQHYAFTDMTVNSWADWTGHEGDPWDWFHLNSVEKDASGNYLIAARYTNAITYIHGHSGDNIWTLGGKWNDFYNSPDSNATHFTDPHMARWTDNGSAIISFDNIAPWSMDAPKRESHGIKLMLNVEKRVAVVDVDFLHLEQTFTASEGSMQVLENGNYFVGYGAVSKYAEFAPNGTLLCSAHYAPLGIENDDTGQGALGSFRIVKQKWIGWPEEPPQFKIVGQEMHVSWNGATELRGWRLDGKTRGSHSWEDLGVRNRLGFETTLSLRGKAYSALQLTALDADSNAISAWIIQDDGKIMVSQALTCVYTIASTEHLPRSCIETQIAKWTSIGHSTSLYGVFSS